MASESYNQEGVPDIELVNIQPQSPPPPIFPRAEYLPIPARPPSRSPPPLSNLFHPNVELPHHPPISPTHQPVQLVAGSGPTTPFGSPLNSTTGIRYPVISCPLARLSTSPIPIPAVQEGVPAQQSLSWDNYIDSPEFGFRPALLNSDRVSQEHRKIDIVSTDYSDLESWQGSIHIGGRLPTASQQQVALQETVDRVFEEEEESTESLQLVSTSVPQEPFPDTKWLSK